MKLRDVSTEIGPEAPALTVLAVGLGFMNQMLGVVEVGQLIRKRLIDICFCGRRLCLARKRRDTHEHVARYVDTKGVGCLFLAKVFGCDAYLLRERLSAARAEG